MKNMYDYYYNVETEEGTCVAPEGVVPKDSWLTGEEIQVGAWKVCFYYKFNINFWERGREEFKTWQYQGKRLCRVRLKMTLVQ